MPKTTVSNIAYISHQQTQPKRLSASPVNTGMWGTWGNRGSRHTQQRADPHRGREGSRVCRQHGASQAPGGPGRRGENGVRGRSGGTAGRRAEVTQQNETASRPMPGPAETPERRPQVRGPVRATRTRDSVPGEREVASLQMHQVLRG